MSLEDYSTKVWELIKQQHKTINSYHKKQYQLQITWGWYDNDSIETVASIVALDMVVHLPYT
jgi:hypothetical protein